MKTLLLRDVHAYYGQSHVLHGVNLAIAPGEIVALLGRNGSGRSTTAKAIMGMVHATGSMRFGDWPLLGLKPFQVARLGVGYVPESRDIFPGLTVHQNLLMGRRPGAAGPVRRHPAEMYRLFPRLAERQHTVAGVLSGGEQQMLSLARTLMGEPSLFIVDEPTEGLAPQVVESVAAFLRRLREDGLSVLLVEQKLQIALDVADRCLVMGHGRIVFDGTPQGLLADVSIRKEWLEV
jgi:branched-chain amino acid transport system ATP-binding protein